MQTLKYLYNPNSQSRNPGVPALLATCTMNHTASSIVSAPLGSLLPIPSLPQDLLPLPLPSDHTR